MKPCILVALLLLPSLSFAAEDGWSTFATICTAEMLPDWPVQVEKGKQWTKASAENLAGLKEMSSKTCPNYLAHRNDGDAIKEFVAKKAATVDVSPLIERDGTQLVTFVLTQFQAQHAAFAPAEIDYAQTPCGVHMRATAEKMRTRLKEIKDTALALATTCISLDEKAAAAAVNKAHSEADAKAQPVGSAPAGSSTKGASDISGTEVDKAKRAKQPK